MQRQVQPANGTLEALRIGLCAAYPEHGPAVECRWDLEVLTAGTLDIARILLPAWQSALAWMEANTASGELHVEPLKKPISDDDMDPVDGGPKELAEARKRLDRVADTVFKLLSHTDFAKIGVNRIWLDEPEASGSEPPDATSAD